jgi:hypothetical protein
MKPMENRQREIAEPTWFRAPTRREHAIAAGLFFGFGISLALLFIVLGGWWFRWVILAMAAISIVRALQHVLGIIVGEQS